ncbi:hypothetical protein WDZ92_44260, partial [Nostoc sp. NIES-2111]
MRELMARVRKRIEELGWEIVEAGQGSAGGAGERRDVLKDEPQITLDLALRILARIPAAPGVFESQEQAVAVHCAFAAALGRDFDEFQPDLREWSCGYDGNAVWTDNLLDNIRRDGVSVTAQGLVAWVGKHAPDLAREIVQGATRAAFTDWIEGAENYPDAGQDQLRASSAVHPLTGKPRYLAKEIIARARKSVAVAAQAPEFTPLTMPSEWDEQAKSYTTPVPIIEDVVFPGVIHGIVAPPNAGKSLYLVHCASAAVHGYLPRYPKQEAAPCNVVLALAEDAEAEAYKRFSEAKRAHANGRPCADGVMLPR